jgi:hypothetical protein
VQPARHIAPTDNANTGFNNFDLFITHDLSFLFANTNQPGTINDRLLQAHVLFFAAFPEQALNFLTSFAETFLDASYQFVLLAFVVAQIVVGKFSEALFQPAFDDVPVTLHFEFIHIAISLSVVWLAIMPTDH